MQPLYKVTSVGKFGLIAVLTTGIKLRGITVLGKHQSTRQKGEIGRFDTHSNSRTYSSDGSAFTSRPNTIFNEWIPDFTIFVTSETSDDHTIRILERGILKLHNSIKLSVAAIANRNLRLQSILSEIVRSNVSSQNINAIHDLIKIGSEFLHFVLGTATAPPNEKRFISHFLETLRNGSEQSKIVIHSLRGFDLPWELLSITHLDIIAHNDISALRDLLCYRALVWNSPTPCQSEAATADVHLPAYIPKILIGKNKTLKYSARIELPYFSRFLSRPRAHVAHAEHRILNELRPEKKYQELQYVRDTIRSYMPDIIHFSSHAHIGTGVFDGSKPAPPSTYISHITIDDEFKVEADVIDDKSFFMPSQPLVFINACEVGGFSGDMYQKFANRFSELGARTIIAPITQINDARSAHFARAFYKYFVRRRRPAAEALWLARAERLRRGDGIGFAYKLYGAPNLHVPTHPDPTTI